MISLLKVLYMHRIYMDLANCKLLRSVLPCLFIQNLFPSRISLSAMSNFQHSVHPAS